MLRIPKRLSRIAHSAVFLFSVFSLSSCVTPLKIQSRVNSLTAQNNYSRAKLVLGDSPRLYGKNNTLLYLLDRGYILHAAGDYRQSIETFEKAKLKFDELYTKSFSGILGTWLINEYVSPYRGEDFERVMINIFQSLNYIMLGDLENALVEARDADSKLLVINNRYRPGEKNAYKEDAFARLLMGILYEAEMTKEGFNNAFISYSKAVETYEKDYARNYNLAMPEILKENILAAAKFMGPLEFEKYRAKFGNKKFLSLEEKAKKGEIYLIQYNGFSPIKTEEIIPLVFPDAYIVKFAFPMYTPRGFTRRISSLRAEDGQRQVFNVRCQIAENIGAIAIKNLDNRKTRVIAKAIASSAGKYLLEKKQEENINKKFGRDAGLGFEAVSSLFNILSAGADLRSWQTLPQDVRIARLLLEPGEYDLSFSSSDVQAHVLEKIYLGRVKVSAGEKKFLIVRSVR